ncbi:MAG: hypothetical protein CMJ39_10145 [Phycisphaerae bacterium]|nr:hypothetical protein [Phycisphaerae bacterium]
MIKSNLLLGLLLMSFGGQSILADVLTVGDAEEAQYVHIQDAIEAASDGDEIIVYPGVYTPRSDSSLSVIDTINKRLTIRSCAGPDTTILDGLHAVRCVVAAGKNITGSVISGFTVRHGVPIFQDINGNGKQETWEANFGGGVIVHEGILDLNNCIIRDNTAIFGGGLYARDTDGKLMDCVFQNNNAESGGGAAMYRDSAPEILGSTFIDNSATFTGGAIKARFSNLEIMDSSIQDNYAGTAGGAIYTSNGTKMHIGSTVFCANSCKNGQVNHIQGQWQDEGETCLSDDCDDVDGNGYPDECDPCLEGSAIDTDGDGLCDAIDPCPEFAGPCYNGEDGGRILIVTAGSSIQAIINVAEDGDTVLIEDGIYYEVIDTLGKAITVRGGDGCGGEPGAVIDGTLLGTSVITCSSGETSSTRFIGLKITNGGTYYGGGMYINGTSPLVQDCCFVGNQSYAAGGGLYAIVGNPEIRGCCFKDNFAFESGGGICIDQSLANITDCHFEGNESWEYGGGLGVIYNGEVTVSRTLFLANTATTSGGGGGAACVQSLLDCTDCQFLMNTGFYHGGGYLALEGYGTVMFCRFESNLGYYGAGLSSEDFGSVDVSNTVFCDNRDPDGLLQNIEGSWDDLGANSFSDNCETPGCPTDFNFDGVVDVNDILIVLDLWGPCLDPDDCITDVNGNGLTDCPDLLATLAAWGPCP